MSTDVYFLCGQGDAATSPGILSMAKRVTGARVKTFNWWQWADMIADADARPSSVSTRVAVAYSLGCNALTWVLGGVEGHPGIKATFNYAVLIDPTTLSILTPLGANLQGALHYHNNSLDPVGHAYLTKSRGFAGELEVIETYLPHLMLDVDPQIQTRTMSEIAKRV